MATSIEWAARHARAVAFLGRERRKWETWATLTYDYDKEREEECKEDKQTETDAQPKA